MAQTIIVPDPAAGQNWSLEVPRGKTYHILSFACQLVTSAETGNRRFGYVIDEGTDDTVYFGSISNTNQTADSTLYLTAYPGSEAVSWTSGMLNLGMPANLYVPAGHRLRTYTGIVESLKSDDAYSNIRVRVNIY